MGTFDAAFEVFPKVLKAVGVRFPVYIFKSTMPYHLMIVPFGGKIGIGPVLVGMNIRSSLDVLLNNWLKRLALAIGHNFGHHLTATLQHAKHNRFALRSMTTDAGMNATSVGFINFDMAGQRKFAVNFGHVLPDLVADTERAFIRYAKLALQFLGGNTMTGGGEQVNGIKPKLQRSAATFKQRAHCWVQMMAATLARICPLCLNAMPLGLLFALRARIILAKANI